MGKLGCSRDGDLDDSMFNKPMPWIGIYVAAASAACAIGMAVDVFRGFRNRKLWFPCKFFSLNATSLTLIAVAIKFSVDLNTSMPRRGDQLAKLSSAVFFCTVMGNSLPSLGTMETKEMSMNVMALGILVITVIVNICIQMGTGVIYVFQIEHAFVMFLMIVLIAILISSALVAPTTKRYLDIKYAKKRKLAMKEGSDRAGKSVAEKLREDLMKHWMMAYTCSPQFVMGRSATCTASGAFCLLSAGILAEAMLRSYLLGWSFRFCHGESDYKWSATLVLVTQTIAVGVGTVGPAFRWFYAINFRCPKKANKACKPQFRVESYWIQTLVEWKECPLVLEICGRRGRRLVHSMKDRVLDLCIAAQTGMVLLSKMVRIVSIVFVSRFLIFCSSFGKAARFLRIKSINIVSSSESSSQSRARSMPDLSHFVLHLEGEEELVELMMENNHDAIDHWIRMGKKQQPRNLIQLLEKSTSLKEFKGVTEFDSYLIPSLDSEDPPNCWALPVVTLTSIAVALPNTDPHLVKQLIRCVHQGLIYVRLVEGNLNEKFTNSVKAAEILWLGADLHHKWLDVDLDKMALQVESPKEVLEGLSSIAKDRFMELRSREMKRCMWDNPSNWHVKALAANSMYRICQTLLLDYGSRNYGCSQSLFERLSTMISDIMGACLTNLPHAIDVECHRSTIEEREESVCRAILLLGRTRKILKILEQQHMPDLDADQMASIDEWRRFCMQKNKLQFSSSSAESDSTISPSAKSDTISTPSDLYISID